MKSPRRFVRDHRRAAVVLTSLCFLFLSGAAHAQVGAEAQAAFMPAQDRAPFVENLGQWPDEALFRASTGGVCAWVVDDGFWVVARRLVEEPGPRRTPVPIGAEAEEASVVGTALRFTFIDAAPAAASGEGHLGHPRHYLLEMGEDSQRWVRGARGHAAVRCAGLYPGVDLLLRTGEGGRFEYDLELGSEADLSAVRVRVEGADGLDVDADGALVVRTPHGDLRQSPPLAYTLEGERVDCSFVLLDAATYGFTAPPVAEAYVIDPGLEWSTLLGGDEDDEVLGIDILPGGDVVVCGWTFSSDFPTTPGALYTTFVECSKGCTNAFLTRFSADGSTAVFSTYLYTIRRARSVRVDSQGNLLYCADRSRVAHRGNGNRGVGVVAKMDASGAQVHWIQMFGTGGNTWMGPGGYVSDLAVSSDDAAVVVGTAISTNFVTTENAYDRTFGGGQDVFVTAYDRDGGLKFATFLGEAGDDKGLCVDLMDDDSIVIGGSTTSQNFPVTPGAFDGTLGQDGSSNRDGFVAVLSPLADSLLFSTFLGGSGPDSVQDLAVSADQEVLVGGWTNSVDFPTTPGAFRPTGAGGIDGFLTRVTPNGGGLVWSTYFGGTDEDRIEAVALGRNNTAICALSTSSPDLPTTRGCYDAQLGTPGPAIRSDIFLAELSLDGATQRYGTYIGGYDDEQVHDLVVDRTQDSDACLLCGSTGSVQYPMTAGAFDTVYEGPALSEGFVTRIDFSMHPFPFGTGKVNSMNGTPALHGSGFPSVSGPGFWLGFLGGIPGQMAFAFYGPTTVTAPFLGGTRYVGDPATRIGPFTLGFLGDALIPVDMDASLIGQTLYYQLWFRDPNDPFGAGLSNALQVAYYP